MKIISLIITIAAAITWSISAYRIGIVGARMLQIEEYENSRFLDWSWQESWIRHKTVLTAFAIAVLTFLWSIQVPSDNQTVVVGIGWLVSAVLVHWLWRWIPPKKQLVFTSRLRRLLMAYMVLVVIMAIVVTCVNVFIPIAAKLTLLPLAFGTTMLPVLILSAANILMKPVEKVVRVIYLRRARKKINTFPPTIVAIAGSYGKTSTKHIMARFLQPQVKTLPTPKSFNTLMGVTRTINEVLSSDDRVFIVEMDAYDTGEIASICKLTAPQIAIITSVGPTHLERFGSVDRIADAIYEVVEALPVGSKVFINRDNSWTNDLVIRAQEQGYEPVSYGIEDVDQSTQYPLDILATHIEADENGSHFVWRWPRENLDYAVNISLLGKHSVLNTTVALAAVHTLGYSVEVAVSEASSLEPVEHRLQLLPDSNGIRVIDDAFNANPVGVHNALSVLASFKTGAKILVTPGIVELGSMEIEENQRYGEHAALVCDRVILMVSNPATAIKVGLERAGMSLENIFEARSLQEAMTQIGKWAKPGDTVLFANDLPDTYL